MTLTFGRVFLFIVTLIVFGSSTILLQAYTHFFSFEKTTFYDSEKYIRTTTYELEEGRWLEFSVVQYQTGIKFITNALTFHQFEPSANDQFPYSVEYEFIGKDGTITKGDYHFIAHYTKLIHQQNQKTIPRWQHSSPDYIVFDSASALFRHPSLLKGIKKIRLRLQKLSPPLQRVAVRVYKEQRATMNNPLRTWRRMSAKEKELKARTNVFDHQLLTIDEIKNVLSHSWHPSAPEGNEGEAYSVHQLFRYIDDDVRKKPELILPEGNFISQDVSFSLPITTNISNNLNAKLIPFDSSTRPTVTVSWYSRQSTLQQTTEHVLTKKDTSLPLPYNEGVVIFRASSPVIVQLYAGKQQRDIVPEKIIARAYEAKKQIRYQVYTSPGKSYPLRLSIYPETEALLHTNITLYDSSGTEISEHDIPLQGANKTRYIAQDADPFPVAAYEPYVIYTEVPDSVKTVEISSAANISLATRQIGARKQTILPDDLYVETYSRVHQSWYTLYPANTENIPYQLFIHQPRIPSTVLDDRKEPQLFEAIYPQESWYGEYILRKKHDIDPIEDIPGGFIYTPLPTNRKTSVTIVAKNDYTQPTLLLQAEPPLPREATVSIDLRTYVFPMGGRITSIPLPLISTGKHDMRVLTSHSQDRAYINHVMPPHLEAEGLSKHTIFRTKKHNYTFDIEKTLAEQSISFHWYESQDQCDVPTTFFLEVTPLSSSQNPDSVFRKSWTFQHRKYILKPSLARSVITLLESKKSIIHKDVFYLPLLNDLPLGHYRISLRKDRHSCGGYLRASNQIAKLHAAPETSYRLIEENSYE